MEGKKLNRRQFVGSSLAVSAALAGSSRVLGANERISIGLIGCGGRGRRAILRQILEFQDETNVEVTAVCDTWSEMRNQAVEQVREATGKEPRSYVHYQDVLGRDDIDAVAIVTPDHQHCRQLIDAAAAGKDAYVEKPLAMTMEELLEAVEIVEKNKRVVQMGTQVRSYPHSVAARQFVHEGRLGKVLEVEQSRNGYRPYWYGRGDRTVNKSEVDWEAFLMMRPDRSFDPKQYAGWYGFHEFSRGPHTNLFVHFIDLVHFITGASTPSKVMTMGGTYRWKGDYTVPDSVEVILEYPEGMLIRYGTRYGNSAGNYFKFFGTRGTIDATRWNWDTYWPVNGEGVDAPDAIEAGTELPRVEATRHVKNWLECLRTREQPNAPMEAGYNHSVACIMSDESYVRGTQMIFDPEKKEIREA